MMREIQTGFRGLADSFQLMANAALAISLFLCAHYLYKIGLRAWGQVPPLPPSLDVALLYTQLSWDQLGAIGINVATVAGVFPIAALLSYSGLEGAWWVTRRVAGRP